MAAALRGEPHQAIGEPLRATLDFLEKLTLLPSEIDDHDIAEARADGWTDEVLCELVVAAALGAGLARRNVGLAAVERWERAR